MDKSKFYCLIYNPTRNQLQTETLENYLRSVQANMQAGFNPADAEVILEIDDDVFHRDALAKAWEAKIKTHPRHKH